jgi:hypothetical protein
MGKYVEFSASLTVIRSSLPDLSHVVRMPDFKDFDCTGTAEVEWISSEVKLGIVCKQGIDVQRNINSLFFQCWTLDFPHCTRTSPLERPKKESEIVIRK